MEAIEPVVLAALIQQDPLLLIGPHGTGKSYLLNRLAAALGLEHRHYNASLLNFDDLVGYPLPNGTGSLEYVQTPPPSGAPNPSSSTRSRAAGRTSRTSCSPSSTSAASRDSELERPDLPLVRHEPAGGRRRRSAAMPAPNHSIRRWPTASPSFWRFPTGSASAPNRRRP